LRGPLDAKVQQGILLNLQDWGATFRMSGATTSRMAGGEELKAA
jgi:hypothetical protein